MLALFPAHLWAFCPCPDSWEMQPEAGGKGEAMAGAVFPEWQVKQGTGIYHSPFLCQDFVLIELIYCNMSGFESVPG